MKMKSSLLKASALCLVVLTASLGFPASAQAKVVNVSVIDYAFSPATANINVNDSVVWVWTGSSHNHNVYSTDSPQAWPSSPIESNPYSYTNQFTTAGSFPYVCTVHGFSGTINVAAPHVPPVVTITNPASGTVYAAPASINLAATATVTDGTVTNIQFLLDSTVLVNQTAAPYTAVASNLAAGNYILTAIATDDSGAQSTNSVSVSVVTPGATAIAPPHLTSTNFTFTFNANIGLNYLVQASTNLSSTKWTPVFTNAPASSTVVTVQLPIQQQASFYRVGRLPNP